MEHRLGIHALESALSDLGTLLGERGLSADLFVIGGAARLLSDPTSAPPTRDVDAAARLDALVPLQPVLTAELESAIDRVGAIHGIGPGWINAAAAQSFDHLVPEGAIERAEVRTWQALTLRIASRADQIRLKFAAATRVGRAGDRHRQNLADLGPSDGELAEAVAWYRTTIMDPRAFDERIAFVVETTRAARDGE